MIFKTFKLFSLRDEDQADSTDEVDNVLQPSSPKRQQTLMDFARSKNHWPKFKNNEQAASLKDYATKFPRDQKDTVNYLDSFLWNTRVNSKVLLHDSTLILFKNHITGIHRDKVVDFSKLITAVTQLIWYISPHHSKFLAHGASLLKMYSHLLQFNDPGRHKHKINKIC